MSEPLLKTESLSVSYGMIRAIQGIGMEVHPGEMVALIGANGAGKSTFLETIIGLHRPHKGTVVFLGRDITGEATDKIVAMGIALCPEGRGILPKMDVHENLLLGAYHNRAGIEKNLERVNGLFPILAERRRQAAGTLSGGQQQMLSIGRALMARPKLLVLDEPSLGLAPIVVDEIFRIIKELTKEGQTVLLSEQNAKKSLQFCGRAYVFETGRIVLSGTSQQLMGDESVVAAYLGGDLKTN